MNSSDPSHDQVVRDEWHVLGALEDLSARPDWDTRLLGEKVSIRRKAGNTFDVLGKDGATLQSQQRYGYLWASLGTPARPLFAIPEFDEPDRRNLNAATFGVHVSAPRAIENFLDMGHFPFVHTDYLGVEPHTEVKEYDVQVTNDGHEVLARRCRFYQPRASSVAEQGYEVEYIYRVPHPYCAVLYKANAIDAARMDVIGLFLQPVDEEHVKANMLLSLIDDASSDTTIRAFQQTIFAQDKPILENQIPLKLPLDPRAEMPAKSDASSITYRRWLRQRGVRYGTVAASA